MVVIVGIGGGEGSVKKSLSGGGIVVCLVGGCIGFGSCRCLTADTAADRGRADREERKTDGRSRDADAGYLGIAVEFVAGSVGTEVCTV